MLEKIGLPARPSLRGNNWVVDASHCQGCSSQFTFINRKHHCRRCGGIFCNSCTQHRMVLRGQGDSPVRICEPCKKLEEAARFELRHGHKSRTGRGSLKSTKPEDEILNEILGSDRKESSSSVQESNGNSFSTTGRTMTGVQSSNTREFIDLDAEGKASSLTDHLENKMESSSPEQLRQQALDEKKKYKVLKGEGKSEEALKAFKRGKELERKADALEISIRRSRRKALTSGNAGEDQDIGGSKESGRKMKPSPQSSNEKHDLNAELRELGWSDMDLHAEDKKSATMSLEGELSSILRGVSQKTDKAKGIHSIDNTQVVAHKRKALMLKREGKLTEAKEELKKAKVLEKQLEEQELLAGVEEESDDELSALVRSLDDNKHEDVSYQYKNLDFDLDNLLGAANTIISDINFEVTDEDMEDPEISAALETLGWAEDSNNTESIQPQPSSGSRESIKSEIISLKREALNQKRAGNIAVAMEQLKKAKMLERDLENFGSQEESRVSGGGSVETTEVMIPKLPSKSKLAIQKELLAIKKKALALRREGRLDEAEKELNKCKVLEHQLEQGAEASRENSTELGIGVGSKDLNRNLLEVEVVEDVTDQDMHDPEYLSVLKNLGWNDKDDKLVPSKPSKQEDLLLVVPSESSANHAPKYAVRPLRRKAEVQRELLGLKRKALSLRRQGETEAADEVLLKTKDLEAEMEEIESRDRVRTAYGGNQENIHKPPSGRLVDQGGDDDVTEEDMSDPTLLSVLQNLGWNGDDVEPVNKQVKPVKEDAKPSGNQSSTINVAAPQSRSEIQREVLNLKRKALALRRKGDIDEAEEVLRRAKVLEIQMDELDTPKPKGALDVAEDDKSEVLRALEGRELRDRVEDVEEVRNVSIQVADGLKVKDEVPDLSMDFKFSKGDSVHSRSQNFDNQSDHLDSKERQALFGERGRKNSLEGNRRQDELSIPHSDVLNDAGLSIEYGFQAISTVTKKDHLSIRNQDNVVHREGKQPNQADNSFQDSSSQSNESSLRQEVLARKKKAVALKREGKLSEAREELRQAKLLEKSLEENNGQVQLNSKGSSISSNNVPSPDRKESSTSTVEQKPSPDRKQSNPSTMEQKPMSARDRFKLQQESLKHKRQALKFRREGQTQEADAEFEKAKAIETQLEQLTDSTKSSASGEEHAGDVSVEDFLDPQLLSALRAIGLENPTPSISRGQETLKPPPKVSTDKMENTDLERSQLEERIKAEKVKAVNLKRLGKQAEALDALRRAKLYEKKLNSLVSS